MAKKEYVFTETVHGLTDDPIVPGVPVRCDPADVKGLIERGVCKEHVATKATPADAPLDADRIAIIVEAIGELDPGDAGLWGKEGTPHVKSIEGVLGTDITSAERDAAWQHIQDAA